MSNRFTPSWLVLHPSVSSRIPIVIVGVLAVAVVFRIHAVSISFSTNPHFAIYDCSVSAIPSRCPNSNSRLVSQCLQPLFFREPDVASSENDFRVFFLLALNPRQAGQFLRHILDVVGADYVSILVACFSPFSAAFPFLVGCLLPDVDMFRTTVATNLQNFDTAIT